MRYLLIALSLCLLGQNAPALANAVAVCDGKELSTEDIRNILLKDSKIDRYSNGKKVVAYCLKLTGKGAAKLSWKERKEIKEFLLPNADEVRRWTLKDWGMRDRFLDVYKHCLADILRGHSDVKNLWTVAREVADIIIP